MIFWLEMLHFKMPLVFTYYSTRMMLAAATSLMLSIFLGPRFIKKLYEWKIGQPIRMEECPLLGELHQKKQDTPTMGGDLDSLLDDGLYATLDGFNACFYVAFVGNYSLFWRHRGL